MGDTTVSAGPSSATDTFNSLVCYKLVMALGQRSIKIGSFLLVSNSSTEL